jgi:hypothetical protein
MIILLINVKKCIHSDNSVIMHTHIHKNHLIFVDYKKNAVEEIITEILNILIPDLQLTVVSMATK